MPNKNSSIVLLIANMIPLFGVLWFDWRVVDILLLYWTESVIIGVLNVLRMLTCTSGNLLRRPVPRPDPDTPSHRRVAAMQAAISPARFNAMKFILIPFFIVHYGIFCFGHLMAINSFFGDPDAQPGAESVMAHFQQRDYWIAVAAIFISHLYSYFVNFIGRGEYQQTSAAQLMHRPYGRIIIMHLTILLGAGLIVYLDSPIAMLLVLIIAKSLIDLRLHRRERDLLEPGLVAA